MADLWQRIAGLSPAKQQLLQRELARRSAAIPADLASRLTGARPMTVAELTVEAHLDETIAPPAGSPGTPPTESNRVLLTGATGFLGRFLLHELLQQTRATIYCLVRAGNLDEARARLRRSLDSAGLEDLATSNRIMPVLGDVAKSHLGLAEATFRELASHVDAIYHCAAHVNWIYPFKTLRAVNVSGTHEALRLAAAERAKPFHFVSTIGVFSSPDFTPGMVREDQPLEDSGALHIGYAQSKWVAEKLVQIAAARGLPTTIFRPALAPHSRSGVFKETDHICRLIKGCVQLGSAPDLPMLIDLAPVDFASAAIVHLARQNTALGNVFHLVNPSPLPWAQVIDHLISYGYPLQMLAYDEWKAKLLGDGLTLRNNALFSLSPLFSEALIENARLPRFDCTRTLAALSGTGIECPPLDGRLLETYVREFVARGFLLAPG